MTRMWDTSLGAFRCFSAQMMMALRTGRASSPLEVSAYSGGSGHHLVGTLCQQTGLEEPSEPFAEYVVRHFRALLDSVEAPVPEEDLAQDRASPWIARDIESAGGLHVRADQSDRKGMWTKYMTFLKKAMLAAVVTVSAAAS